MTITPEQQLYLELLSNPLLFFHYVLRSHFTLSSPPFHKEIIDLLLRNSKYNCVIAPRDHSKSTLITVGYVLYAIAFHLKKFIIIISDTETQAKEHLEAITHEIENNELFIQLFGDLKGRDKWGETEIITSTGIKVVARGATQKIRGRKHRETRPDLIICDDLENDENVASKEQRDKMFHWFYKAVLPALSLSGQLVYIGTIIHYDSLLNKVRKDRGFKQLFFQAIEQGKPIWEAKFSLETLYQIKERLTAQGLLEAWQTEYMNDPISDENSVFKKEWFRYFQAEPSLLRGLSKFIVVDPAISQKETADYTVVMAVGVDGLNQIYVLEYKREHMLPNETIDCIFQLASKWKVSKIGIESVAYQKSLIWFLKDEMKRRNKFYLVEPLIADKDKERRIKGLQPRYAIGSVYHRPYMTALEEELLLFPKSPTDDITDCLAYVPQIAFPGQTAESVNISSSRSAAYFEPEPASVYSNYE